MDCCYKPLHRPSIRDISQWYDFTLSDHKIMFLPVFSRCVGRWGHYTTNQDGGFVTKDLRTPVQCGEDDAVWAINTCVWCLQNHQRESPRSPDRTRLVDDSESVIYIMEIYRNLHLHTVFHCVFQLQIMASFCPMKIPEKESGSSLEEHWTTTCCEME